MKSIFGILVILSAVLLLAGCTGNKSSAGTSATPQGLAASGSSDPSACLAKCGNLGSNMNGALCQEGCYQASATVALDGTKCQPILSISNGGDMTIFYNNCVDQVALKKNDPSVCSILSGTTADSCVMALAMNDKDPSICAKISDPQTQRGCTAEVGAISK